MAPQSVVVNHKGQELSQSDVKDHIKNLKDMILADEELNGVRTDEEYILRWLHSCSFNIRYAYKRAFWKMVHQYPDWFQPTGPLYHKKHLEMNTKQMLNGTDHEGRAVYLTKLKNVQPAEISFFEAAHLDDLWIETIIDDERFQSKGLSIIVDVSGTPWKMMKWATPHNITVGVRKLQLYPVKDMVVHVVNTTLLMTAGVKVIFPFLSAQMKEKIKFHFDDLSSLHKYISPEILPPEYGGTAEIDYDRLNQNLYDKDKEITEKLKYYSHAIKAK